MSHPAAGRRLPGPSERLRCSGCGNLTRFDVTRTTRTRQYWHFDLAGDHRVDEDAELDLRVEEIACRWCGRSDAIEVVDRNDADGSLDPAAD